jgi:glycosyltransferase involved in cell wall biosynthesis
MMESTDKGNEGLTKVGTPLVSIMIINYNYDSFLKSAIDSALNQTYPNLEIIVVDDGSTDNSRDIIRAYGSKIVPVFKENGGAASASNAGFLNSRGEIICMLDSDDLFAPQKVEEVVKVFTDSENSEIEWCFNTITQIDPSTGSVLRVMSPGVPSSKVDWRRQIIERGEKPFFAPSTSALSFRRRTLAKVLPMPEVEKMALHDNYMKFAVVSLSQGFYLAKELSVMSIHNNNAFTNSKNWVLLAKSDMVTAYWLRKNFGGLQHFTNRLFRTGLANYWHCRQTDENILTIIKDYFQIIPLLEKIQILLVASLHYTDLTSRIRQFKATLPKT